MQQFDHMFDVFNYLRDDLNLALERVLLGSEESSLLLVLLPPRRRPRPDVVEVGLSCCSSAVDSEFVFGFEWPFEWPLTPFLLFALLLVALVLFLDREGDAGGVALEHIFLAKGSGDLSGGECE